ncbi:uncharacterized protein UTRI_04858 [Ustilago trichophora]|uniref:Uncharacterized protein n=1 Tax=Ustilago trichophora TaxID=86804 RepID=A0A5C3EG49_9BASI|nr:uncharacterized protein UTRI_04858 [Ustilago trichophora]
MTSQQSASAANTAATASSSQSYLLAPLQSSTSSNVPITPSKARKQAQAQRTRLVALSKHLMTRLQYANFKVEHGWSKQSLSEVENLYYRQHQSSSATSAYTNTAASTATAHKSASTSPNNKAPVTPGIVASTQTQHSVGSRLFKDAAVKKIDVEGGDVFGGYGLATPPASAGSVPGATSYLTSKRGRSTSSTPISPPNTSSNSSATKAAPAASNASKRSPNSTTVPRTTTAAGGATSYADFWSRVGSTTTTTTATATNATAGSRPISPTKKRSADQVTASDATIEQHQRGPTHPAAAAATITSPNKRVRMESDTTSSSSSNSPAKAALAERGPSFAASSARRH